MPSPLAIPLPPPLAGERAAVTGTLASMTHRRAVEVVRRHGGEATVRVSGQTTLLIVGEEGWPLDAEGRPSKDFQKAETLRQSGADIRIVSETDFLRMVGLATEETAARLYTPARLHRLLGVRPSVVRRWERIGLLRPAKKVGRLPYFDFREVTRLRSLTELLADGVPKERLEASLRTLLRDSALGDAEDVLSRLDLLSDGGRVFARDRLGLFQPGSGQRLFDFQSPEPPAEDVSSLKFPVVADAPRTPAEWQDRGLDLLEAGALPDAAAAFREAVRLQPDAAELHYCLADALYRAGSVEAALERFCVATEWDPEYVEAWTQLGLLHAERDEPAAAREALERASALFDDYAEPHFHLAEVCRTLGDADAAETHLRRFLELEPDGPWADEARELLSQS